MKYAALAAAVAAVSLPETAAFSASGALPLRAGQLSATKAHCVHRHSPALSMSAERKGVLGKLGQAAKGAAFAAVLGMGVIAPRKALADGEFSVSADGMVLEEPVLLQPPAQTSGGFDIVRAGVAGGAGAATFGGLLAVAIKKQKTELDGHAEHFEEELKRLENFKQEFLDGVPSDNSLMASLNKAMNPTKSAPKEEEEDEFEKNVRLFLEEEQAKEDKKKGNPPAAKQGGATLLERPSDPSGDKTEEWMNDVVFEDKPAEIDDEQLKRLQRMFGTGDGDKK